MIEIAVIGGGAAGFFSAIKCAADNPNCLVTIFEKSSKVLAKVRVSGGGRCNVTHACFDFKKLPEFYPRGKKELIGAFSRFNVNNTIEWFESRGVNLKTEADGRMFPVTDNSQTIIDCLLNETKRLNISIHLNHALQLIKKVKEDSFELTFADEKIFHCNKLILTTGGFPQLKSFDFIASLGHTIIPPVPSLFTFNIPHSPLKGLEGIAVADAIIRLEDSKLEEQGALLITHWGISGPAAIKLSAWAARWLNEKNYQTSLHINWLPQYDQDKLNEFFKQLKQTHPSKKIFANSFFNLPQRLWERVVNLAGIAEAENISDVNKQKINHLIQLLTDMTLICHGKTTYKEEFVTCGGVSLKEVNLQTMESTKVKGLYFAGEVLDIDGVTGGFNFQAAWTTAWLAGLNAAKTD